MVDEVTIEDLKPKEDKFTLSDFFTDDDDVVTDLGDGIEMQDISSEDPQGFFGGLGATGVDLLRDYRNTGLGLAGLIGETLPIGNLFSPSLKDYKYKDPEGDVMFPDGIPYVPEVLENIINETYAPSEVAADNPYKNYFTGIRAFANSIPAMAAAVGSRGGLPYLVNRLPAGLQKLATQAFPYLSGRGTMLPPKKPGGKFYQIPINRKNLMQPSSLRNMTIAAATKPLIEGIMSEVNAAPINTGIQDRNYAVFDDYMQDRMSNLKNQRTMDQGPGPRDNYRGL